MPSQRVDMNSGSRPFLRRAAFFTAGLLLISTQALLAQDQSPDHKPLSKRFTELFQIHVFGTWAFGKTDGNRYLLGNEDGDFENAAFSLNLTSTPLDRLRFVSQLQLDDSRGDLDGELDYAFLEWKFSSAARLRVGRVKHPFGIYGEIFDVGTLRPFVTLPQGLYGPSGFTAESYNGLGLVGDWPLRGGWQLSYDVYGGQIQGVFERPPIFPEDRADIPDGLTEAEFRINDMIGMQLDIATSIPGLSFGVSAFSGHHRFDNDILQRPESAYQVYGAHTAYEHPEWWIRTEYARLDNDDIARADGYYLEIAYRLDRHWQVAARYDWWEIDVLRFQQLPPLLAATSFHRERGLGLNYWFSHYLVIKLNYFFVDGNRFAFPDSRQSILGVIQSFGGLLDRDTDGLFVAAQFSF